MQHELEAVRHDAFAVDGGDRYHGCPTCMPPTATGRSGEDEGVVRLQLVEAEKRALDLIEVRGLVPFRHVLLARERKQVLVLGPEGERLPLADGGQIRIVHPLARRAEHSRRIDERALQIRRLQQGCRDLVRGNRDLIAIVSRLGNDRAGLSLLRLYCRMRFRRELEHGCLLAFI
jgi:hypothetical protein